GRAVPALAGSDPQRFLERRDKHLPVADAAGAGGRGDQRNDSFGHVVGHDDLDLHFWQEIDRVFVTAIHLGVTLLSTEAPDLAHGHADDAGRRERVLHVVELERLDDRLDPFHGVLPRALGRHRHRRRFRRRGSHGMHERCGALHLGIAVAAHLRHVEALQLDLGTPAHAKTHDITLKKAPGGYKEDPKPRQGPDDLAHELAPTAVNQPAYRALDAVETVAIGAVGKEAE